MSKSGRSQTREFDEERLFVEAEALLAAAEPGCEHWQEMTRRLLELAQSQHRRMQRLLQISDGFYAMTRADSESMARAYDHQIRRLEKLARISDRYQRSLMDITRAYEKAAMHDVLTGMNNRRYLEQSLKSCMERLKRVGTPFFVCLLDVDHFKQVNDQYGHEVGDDVLCHVADMILSQTRAYDISGRWGGEEFLMLVQDTTLEEAQRMMERLREVLKMSVVSARTGATLPLVTVSAGLVEAHPEDSMDDLLKAADDVLYQAKETGRDRVVVASRT